MERGSVIAKGESKSLIESLQGKVFETVVSESDMAKLENKYKIVNFHNQDIGKILIRYITHEPLPNSKLVEPSLNDFYLSKVKEV
ncbi:hypothetical protein [Clostridium niameyense]|nr:hypothetical protein [Clostridium niameyense]